MIRHRRPGQCPFRRGSVRGLPVLAIAIVVLGVGTSTAGLFKKKCKQRPKRCPNECIEVPYELPNNGFHATRWRRWAEPTNVPCGESVVPFGHEGPEPHYAPQPETYESHVPQWNGTPTWNEPSPVPRDVPHDPVRDWRDAPVERPRIETTPIHPRSVDPAPNHGERPGRDPLPVPGLDDSHSRLETREWTPETSSRGRTIPQYSGVETGARRLSFEIESQPSASSSVPDEDALELPTLVIQYPTREWSPESERPVDAVLVGRSSRVPAVVRPLPAGVPGRPVGRPGPAGYYRLVSKPLAPQPPRTASDRIVR